MLSNEDLAALLPRVALRDRAAFERVYRATCAHLLGVAFRILNDRERAEQVFQEAFMDVTWALPEAPWPEVSPNPKIPGRGASA